MEFFVNHLSSRVRIYRMMVGIMMASENIHMIDGTIVDSIHVVTKSLWMFWTKLLDASRQYK